MRLLEQLYQGNHREQEIFSGLKKNSKTVALFGAGTVAPYTLGNLKKFGVQPACICDNNPKKQGSQYLGLPVLSYKDFKAKHPKNTSIVISASNMAGIRNWLLEQGENAEDIIAMGDFREPYSAHTDIDFVRANAEKYEEAYASLSEDLSKKIFLDLMDCKLSGDNGAVMASRTHDPYFDPGIVKLAKNEVFVDCGAYTGDTVEAFVKSSGGVYEKIIALEPDGVNFQILSRLVSDQKLSSVELQRLGAWHKKDTLSFSDERDGVSRITGADSVEAGAHSIEVDTLDHILNGQRASFIKMDIEGAERNAILGAENTIKKYAPRMAASIYHKREDMFDILLLLKSYVPDYKFYVRNYSDTAADTVLYAVK